MSRKSIISDHLTGPSDHARSIALKYEAPAPSSSSEILDILDRDDSTPALKEGNWTRALINGAVLGFVCYATYDLTNQATLANWSMKLTLIDLAWGTTLTATCAVAGYFAARWAEGKWG